MKTITKDLNEKGFAKIGLGIFLNTSEYLIAEQKIWESDDPCKNDDYTIYPFWITTDDGIDPIGVFTIKEAFEILL